MFNVIVRSRSDAKAFESMVNKFYPDWGIRVHTLHGSRRFSEAYLELESIVRNNELYIVMLGKEDVDLAREIARNYSLNTAVHIVPFNKLRNTRIEQLAYEFDKARSLFRLSVYWDDENNTYLFGLTNGVCLEDYEINPAYDVFIGVGDGFYKTMYSILGSSICNNPLLIRKFSGVHDVYCGLNKVAIVEIPDHGLKPVGRLLKKEWVRIDLDRLVKSNENTIKLYENISKHFLERQREWVDTVVVPWSGGKDSTVALILALSVFPKSIVKALYVDTGVEFPWTAEYIDEISKALGVEVHKVYASIDRGLIHENKPMPTHDNRWCTERKIAAVTRGVSELSGGNTLIITGDRDSESRSRSTRPPLRVVDEKTRIVSPIKFWGTTHVQLYLLRENIPLNPLYVKGFYRIGCYICPSLRSWELYILTRDQTISSVLSKYEIYRRFLRKRLEESRLGTGGESACDLLV